MTLYLQKEFNLNIFLLLALFAALMVYLLAILIIFTSKLIIKVVKTYLTRTGQVEGVSYATDLGISAFYCNFTNFLLLMQDFDRLQEPDAVPQLLSVSKTSMRIQALDAFRG